MNRTLATIICLALCAVALGTACDQAPRRAEVAPPRVGGRPRGSGRTATADVPAHPTKPARPHAAPSRAGYIRSASRYQRATASPPIARVPAKRDAPATSQSYTAKTLWFWSPAVRMRLKYTVCLPPGYDLPRNAHRRYPVIYLLHGWPGNTRQWIVQGGLLSSLNALSQEHEIQPMIVVSPEAMPSKNDPVNEYLNSYLGNWETYVYRDLVRLMDTHYRTIPSPRGRAIAGLSTGGYGAMNIGLQHRDVFGLIGSFSGYFILPSTDQLVRNEPELERLDSPMYYLPKLEGSLPPMYLYVGAQDRRHVAENEEFARLLAARHADYFFATYPGGHTWQLWKDHLPGFLIWASRRLA